MSLGYYMIVFNSLEYFFLPQNNCLLSVYLLFDLFKTSVL